MRALSGLGMALAIVSGLLFLALIAELYYIFWWKKRCNNSHPTNFITKFFLLCFKKPLNSPETETRLNGSYATPVACNNSTEPKDSLLKASINGEETVDAELMRLHSLSGPPRFLFTIKEESREDLESDDGRSRGGRSRKGSSLGDLLHCSETPPVLTPLSSPPLHFKKLGFNPLFESSSSPPPKLKFLKDAEEKLQRRWSLMEASRSEGNGENYVVLERKSKVTPLPPPPLSSIKTDK